MASAQVTGAISPSALLYLWDWDLDLKQLQAHVFPDGKGLLFQA